MKGIYILLIRLTAETTLHIGKLKETTFPKGNYAYVGSAQTNLEKRVQRHLKKEKHLFWHIDYLLNSPNAAVTQVLWREAPKTQECQTAQTLSQHGAPIEDFGCSDCNCLSHLIRLTNPKLPPLQMQPLNLNHAQKT